MRACNRIRGTFAGCDYIEYLYDDTHQLTRDHRKDSGGSTLYYNNFFYDDAGNRTRLEYNDGITTHVYDKAGIFTAKLSVTDVMQRTDDDTQEVKVRLTVSSGELNGTSVELLWNNANDSSPFTRYEVHKSTSSSFTPSPARGSLWGAGDVIPISVLCPPGIGENSAVGPWRGGDLAV